MLNLTDRARARFPSSDTFKVTDTLIQELLEELRSSKAIPVRIAAKFGVPVALVRFIANETPVGTSNFTKHSEDGWGKASLRDFIIARRPASGLWAQEDEAMIQGARDMYDAGIVEMIQGRDSDFIIQYAIPRRKVAKRQMPWFKLEQE